MIERLKQWFPLRAGESRLVFSLGFILFANYAAMGITKVVSVSGFLGTVKDHYILLVWAVDMVLLILATPPSVCPMSSGPFQRWSSRRRSSALNSEFASCVWVYAFMRE